MPVQAVAVEVEWNRVDQAIDGLHDLEQYMMNAFHLRFILVYLLSVLLCRTICDGERPRDKVVLYVNNDNCRPWPHNLKNITLSLFLR